MEKTMKNSGELEIGVDQAAALKDGGGPGSAVFLDIRESDEVAVCRIGGARHIPMGNVPDAVEALPRDVPLVVFCHHGMRSLRVTGFLRERGFENAVSMQGGIEAWSLKIDPNVPRY